MTTQEGTGIPTPVRVHGLNGDDLEHRCFVMMQTIWGYIHLAGDGRLRVIEGSGAEHTLGVADEARRWAESLDGQPARVHFDETVLDGTIVDQTVVGIWESDHEQATFDRRPRLTPAEMIAQQIAETGEPPISGDEFIRQFQALFETDEQRRRFVADLSRGGQRGVAD